MAHGVRFHVLRPGGDRIHHVTEQDVRVVLSRLPVELWRPLRAVHFNDWSQARTLGYVTRGHREIALCALPPRMSLTSGCLAKGQAPEAFGAQRGRQWPELAIRRYLLYHTFLHELGHLQVVDGAARSDRLKFAREKLAEEFATRWRKVLWSEPFDHPDPVHNPPSIEAMTALNRVAADR
ncbi:MAG TPA: hypothetical protein VFF52_00250 [Isosphaeraceae bacterium]|nr:hypothetical protein [Isosphaeraceae bacterium]